ncbi:Antagonist of like heterochromatin protein [Thalictrum thalictroides]|uniref:Antagonist of like heterochromatin protein n=1 Tax=Thalictrum thalictroides TaxID=46969 RepID=A0A7J6X551_THATH|nr:Antagonist of like heterochromatin protein [Thalictrum thalictroides]
MDSRLLASLLSSLVSQILLVLLFLFPTTNTNNPSSSSSSSSSHFPLLFNLLTSTQFAATSISLHPNSKKRKRSSSSSPLSSSQADDKEIEEEDNDSDSSFSSLQIPPPESYMDQYKVCFKMSCSTFEWLTSLLEPLLECRDPINLPINLSAEIRLGIGLFRLATGSGYEDIARRFNVSEFTCRFCTKQLCRVLCTNFRFWVGFPNSNELEPVSSSFEDVSGFPNCCGVLDCTRFKISTKGREHFREESVVAQIVVDNSSKILSIVAGFRGDKGDSRVLKCSSLYNDVEEGRLLNGSSVDIEGVSVPQYLISDGGYPLLPWLMVPFANPVSASCEGDFNAAIQKMRLPALRTLASLRNWGILNKPIEEEYKTAVACIGACSILHNALLTRDDFSALAEEIEDYSMHGQCCQYYPDNSLEENTVVNKASDIRNVLATKVSEARDLNQPTC